MANTNSNNKGKGIVRGIVIATTIILTGLKLAGVIDISWLGVFAPFLIWLAVVVVLALALTATTAIAKSKLDPIQQVFYNVYKNSGMTELEAVAKAIETTKS